MAEGNLRELTEESWLRLQEWAIAYAREQHKFHIHGPTGTLVCSRDGLFVQQKKKAAAKMKKKRERKRLVRV